MQARTEGKVRKSKLTRANFSVHETVRQFVSNAVFVWNSLQAHVFPSSFNLGSLSGASKSTYLGRQGYDYHARLVYIGIVSFIIDFTGCLLAKQRCEVSFISFDKKYLCN